MRNVLPFSTRMTDWLNQCTRSGCGVHLTPSPGCLTGWGSVKTSGILSGCSAAPAVWWGTSRKQLTNGR